MTDLSIQKAIMKDWQASRWEHAGTNDSNVCMYTLFDAGDQPIVTDTLLNLRNRGMDYAKEMGEKQ